ncbi:MAG: hypothetical protein COV46_07250 [Deltaproteobacteria bacterium CG11_big_fil_rev_8_21_14_0_20_49_13]|nr:MAG: hypothetical protein COV46_07250 [Deltaproteobacteria bacterium CG11_big_fil_rev_8_21_14_0_20_49_13]
MPISVEVKNVTKTFAKEKKALDGISIDFAEGKLHGLIGSEGAGKTTLLRVIMRLLNLSGGEIGWKDSGKPIDFFEIRDKISYMPGSQSLFCLQPSFHRDLSFDGHIHFGSGQEPAAGDDGELHLFDAGDTSLRHHVSDR